MADSMPSSSTNEGYWNIQIKLVGDERDFVVMLHPDDDLAQLYDEIHCVTGLPREQQRLIYRGRLLGKADNEDRHQKMKDIVGLMDGHTIHLMKGRGTFEEGSAAPTEQASNESPSTESAANSNTSSSSSSTSSLLASLLGGERNRRTPFRLREEDLETPDPGSMESVRQGLMTMRTMSSPYPRQFFVGQWIDCRDTVNQWLEATVVDIVSPREILRDSSRSFARPTPSSAPLATRPTYDPAVCVTDLDGRRRLLLEECHESESEEQINGIHYRRRANDQHVQILHIHYNGWPVRWDEWIRSDSERIRLFRVRTRHPNSNRLQSPTVQAPMQDPPNTHLTHDESTDREAILPELLQAMQSVEGLLENAVSHARSHDTRTIHLPWGAQESAPALPETSLRTRQRNLRALAPALDRLGRTLTDCAPHIAALAASMDDPEQMNEHLETIEEHPSTLGGLLSLLSRERRPRRTSQSISSSLAIPSNDVSVSVASSTTGGNEPTAHEEDEEEEEVVDPDLSDYNYGSIVNTTRGEVRTGPRATRSSGDDVAGLLGAYFAAAGMGGSITATGQGNQGPEGLGRLLRERSNGGIDIHIHAVVTAPGMEGGIGIAAANGPASMIPTALLVPTNDRQSLRHGRPPQRQHQVPEPIDDHGIFSELYSENPEPVNPNSPNQPQGESWADDSASIHDVSQASRDENGSPRRSSSRNPGRRNGVLGRLFRRGVDGE